MAKSRSRRRRERARSRREDAFSRSVPRSYQVIEQVHFGKKTLSSRRAARPRARRQTPVSLFVDRRRREAQRRAREVRPSPRSFHSVNALRGELRPFRCKPRPNSREAGRSPKRKRGFGGGGREWKPWCR